MSFKFFSKLILSTLLVFVFVSCEEEKFYDKDFLTNVEDQFEKENEEGADINNVIEGALMECDDALVNNTYQTHVVTVSFPAAIECEFNEAGINVDDINAAGNGPRLNGKVRARMEQNYTASLPSGSTVCDMDFNFPTQQMQYDDEVFLLLNNYVVMSSQDYSEVHPQFVNGFKINDMGFMEYKWMGDNGLYNLDYDWNLTPKYCLGLDSSDPEYNEKCFIPPTETLGQLKLDIPKADIVKLGILSRNFTNPQAQTELDFGFVTIGDNDNGDCEHSAYSFQVSVKYIQN